MVSMQADFLRIKIQIAVVTVNVACNLYLFISLYYLFTLSFSLTFGRSHLNTVAQILIAKTTETAIALARI